MRLTGIGAGNHLFNAAAVNQKFNRIKSADTEQGNGGIQFSIRDSVFISKQGKQNNMIQQLMNQKQLIQECKDTEMKRGLEKGYVNQDKLDGYSRQLEMLDEKIAETMTEQSVEDVEKKDTDQGDNKMMTEEEFEKGKLVDMLSISSGIDQYELLLSAKEKMDGEANVLKVEIELDNGRALGRASESKYEELAEIESKSSDLLEQAGEKLSDINNILSESKNVVLEEEESEEQEADML